MSRGHRRAATTVIASDGGSETIQVPTDWTGSPGAYAASVDGSRPLPRPNTQPPDQTNDPSPTQADVAPPGQCGRPLTG